ncbi:response regulator transcription factor [Anaerostipes sp.]|uniref:response regulator transcription factor n=1 Tax=Anaerostipes sp. TaxID=1872530 RepID=UPI0025C0EDC7|nr:response regulator [Anaerostipes sp.]MBS7008913.1 response regulator [Anaerostipes sp.]
MNILPRIAVCEDDKSDILQFKDSFDKAINKFLMKCSVEYFFNGDKLLAAVRNGKIYDLIILDIIMDELDGIETARCIQELLPDAEIAFFSSCRDFGPEAFSMNALHYQLKPVTARKIEELLLRYSEKKKNPISFLTIQAGERIYKFPIHRIQKLQSSNKGVDVYISGQKEPQWIPVPLIKVQDQLKDKRLLNISRGLIVNLDFILCIDKELCKFKDGTSSLISRKIRREVRKAYNDYLFGDIEKGN